MLVGSFKDFVLFTVAENPCKLLPVAAEKRIGIRLSTSKKSHVPLGFEVAAANSKIWLVYRSKGYRERNPLCSTSRSVGYENLRDWPRTADEFILPVIFVPSSEVEGSIVSTDN